MRSSTKRALTALACALALAIPAAVLAQAATDHGLSLLLFDNPKPGVLRSFVRFTDPAQAAKVGASPAPADFSLTVQGGAKVTAVKPFKALGLTTVTIAAIDRSGSFKNGANAAFQVLDHLADSVTPTERLGIMLFGTEVTEFPTRTSAADAHNDVSEARAKPTETRTRLLSSLQEAVLRASREGAQGFREVLVFTDAGEESAALNWEKVADDARAKGVRISVFVLPPKNPSVDVVTKLDWLAGMKARTGGIYENLSDVNTAIAGLDRARQERNDWYAVDSEFCGMKAGQFEGVLRVQYRKDQAFTADTRVVQLLGKEAEAPCPGAALSCGEACPSWQACDTTKGHCAAKKCTQDAECGAAAHCEDASCAAGARGLPAWLFLVGGAALALIVAGVLLTRKKPLPPPPEEKKADPPKPPEPLAPIEEAKPLDVAAAVTLEALPETHLVALNGPFPPGQKWRLFQKLTKVGAAPDTDIRFDIAQISSRHAEFQLFPNGNLYIRDLGSANGTFVNGRRLAKQERVELKVGDQVQFSSALLVEVQRPGALAPAPEAPAPAQPAPQAAPTASAPAGQRPKKATIIDRGDK